MFADLYVAELRTRYALGSVSIRALAREAGITNQAMEPLLKGKTYKRAGGPIAPRHRPAVTLLQRFSRKVKLSAGCWRWTGGTRGRYGLLWVEGRNDSAHRVAYALFVGDIPEGYELDHLCRNPRCVNPEHLEAVTPRVNVFRGIGPSADNARKTHCKRGHALAGHNVRLDAKGRRVCRPCMAYLQSRWRENMKRRR